MIVDEEAYLDHHGIKGMKWGVRKEGSSGKPDHSSRNKKIAIGVGAGVLAAGAAATAVILSHNYNVKLKDFNTSTKTYSDATNLINNRAIMKVAQIHGATGRGELTKDQGYRLRKLASRQARSAIAKAAKNVTPHPGGPIRYAVSR